jgi:hypothetical protein
VCPLCSAFSQPASLVSCPNEIVSARNRSVTVAAPKRLAPFGSFGAATVMERLLIMQKCPAARMLMLCRGQATSLVSRLKLTDVAYALVRASVRDFLDACLNK